MARISRRNFLAASGAVAFGPALISSPAFAQQYPSRYLHFVTGTAAGSGGDLIVRHFAEKIRAKTGRAVLVENRIGGAGLDVTTLGVGVGDSGDPRGRKGLRHPQA